MELIAPVLALGFVILALWWALSSSVPGSAELGGLRAAERDLQAHAAYVAGDSAGVEAALPGVSLDTFVSLATALGHYRRALDAVRTDAPDALQPDAEISAPWLIRINASEALTELGRADEARVLLERPLSPDAAQVPLLVAGKGTAYAWVLGTLGRWDEALHVISQVNAADLGPMYEAEAFLTRAMIFLGLGRWADARAALSSAAATAVRASTIRNAMLHEARLLLETGDHEGARAKWREIKDHGWRRQGGAGLLALGDAFLKFSFSTEAAECWQLAVEQDGESASARVAAERLA